MPSAWPGLESSGRHGLRDIAATVVLAALAGGAPLRPGWALLPVAALTLPSVGLAAGGVRLAPTTGAIALAPAKLSDLPTCRPADLPAGRPRSGLRPLFVDLRRTALPAAGDVPLRIEAGVRRTIVALPHDRCVRVDVRYELRTFTSEAATVLAGGYGGPLSFGSSLSWDITPPTLMGSRPLACTHRPPAVLRAGGATRASGGRDALPGVASWPADSFTGDHEVPSRPRNEGRAARPPPVRGAPI